NQLSNGVLLALFDAEDNLTLYQRVGESSSIIGMEVPFRPSATNERLWISALFYFLIAVVVFLLVRPFARHLLKLKSAAINFGLGDFSSRLDLPVNTTLTPIADAFNTMANKIERLLLTQRDLVNSVSHELRTPLARLKFGFEELEFFDSTDQTISSINAMKCDVKELETLIDEMLQYAEVNQVQNFSKKTVSLKRLIKQLVLDVRTETISIIVVFADSVNNNDEIMCNQKSGQRALANVLRNALRFAESTCEIRIDRSEKWIFIDISDDGSGVNKLDTERVFEPFYRGNDRSQAVGYGLGLAIAQTITIKHEGSLTISHGSLKGACFRFCFPG
ncbi:MAG: ATP-binding protein, partial [Proteobacteria bacterium]|nr:ATP-binding protein [Pseudomonadota bacterium]